jgi:hypothetical protein
MPLNRAGIVRVSETGGVLWRCEQPDAEAAWTLRESGVTQSIKLNTNAEFLDLVEGEMFRDLLLAPLNPFNPDKYAVLAIAGVIDKLLRMGTKVVVHGTHGVDRTGLVVGAYRLIYGIGYDLRKVNNERQLYGSSPLRSFVDNAIGDLLEDISNETHKSA